MSSTRFLAGVNERSDVAQWTRAERLRLLTQHAGATVTPAGSSTGQAIPEPHGPGAR